MKSKTAMLESAIQEIIDFVECRTNEWPDCIPEEPIPLDDPLVVGVIARLRVDTNISSKINILKPFPQFYDQITFRFDTEEIQSNPYLGTTFEEYSKKCESFSDLIDRIRYLNALAEYDTIGDFIDEFRLNVEHYSSIPSSTRTKLADRFKYELRNKTTKMRFFDEKGIKYRIVTSDIADPEFERDLNEEYDSRTEYQKFAEFHDYIPLNNKFMNIYDDDLFEDNIVLDYRNTQFNNMHLCKQRDNLFALYYSIIVYIDAFQ